MRLSRGTVTNIHENLFWAFFYNVICIPLAAGLFSYKMNPMVGAAAMSISSFTVCMNALRLNLFKLHDAGQDKKRKNPAAAVVEKADLAPQPAGCPVPEAAGTQVTYQVKGMMCAHCEGRVKKALEGLDGVVSAKADHTAGTVVATVLKPLDYAQVQQAVAKAGYEVTGATQPAAQAAEGTTVTLKVKGMMCAHCEGRVKKALEGLEGITSAQPDHTTGTVKVTETRQVPENDIKSAILKAGYEYEGMEA